MQSVELCGLTANEGLRLEREYMAQCGYLLDETRRRPSNVVRG